MKETRIYTNKMHLFSSFALCVDFVHFCTRSNLWKSLLCEHLLKKSIESSGPNFSGSNCFNKAAGKGELNPIRGQFPIKTEEELIELEEKIKLNRDIYITAMKSILQPAGALSGLNFILSEDIVLAYNVDGVQGKKALRTHKEFFAALLECISPGDEPPKTCAEGNAKDEEKGF
ncbi:uncharacterized protein LOC108163244 [Drosophila miranda]|uniref:uncharacterized protein LOC108163244 n=1 Tax=Drosophila miranda TaxID=7229 RepID=UPI00143F3C98|nr:uncharacterized protein LOC108163244 [Drosophila miranda]